MHQGERILTQAIASSSAALLTLVADDWVLAPCSKEATSLQDVPNQQYDYSDNQPFEFTDPTGEQWGILGGNGTIYLPLCIRWLFIPITDMDPDYYKRERDCAIKTYRGGIDTLRRMISGCCSQFGITCNVELDFKFYLDPIRGPGGPIRSLPNVPRPLIKANDMPCDFGGVKILIVGTNPGEAFNGGDSEAVDGGSVATINATCGPGRRLPHELGHCGRYRPDPGTEDKDDHRHCNIPGHVMCPGSGQDIDRNWCDSIACLANKMGRSKRKNNGQNPSTIPW